MEAPGKKIKQLREVLGKSQKEFGLLAGKSQNTISQYELDVKSPPFKIIQLFHALAKQNKININFLDN